MNCKQVLGYIKALMLSMLIIVAPGCCWGGCFDKCKPCQPCAPCKPCKPCDDSCVVKEPQKPYRSYQKNVIDRDEDDDIEIVEVEDAL